MTLKESLTNLIADFASMSRTPEFRPKSPECHAPSPSPTNRDRRHSLNISVGTEEIPKVIKRRSRADSLSIPEEPLPEHQKYNKNVRRQSAPCVSAVQLTGLKKKIQHIKERGAESDDEIIREEDEADMEQARRLSAASIYRV